MKTPNAKQNTKFYRCLMYIGDVGVLCGPTTLIYAIAFDTLCQSS